MVPVAASMFTLSTPRIPEIWSGRMVGWIVHHCAFHANQRVPIAICREVEKTGDLTRGSVASTTYSPRLIWLPQAWTSVQ